MKQIKTLQGIKPRKNTNVFKILTAITISNAHHFRYVLTNKILQRYKDTT